MRRLWGSIVLCVACALTACSDKDGEDYPPLLTDMVVAESNGEAVLSRVTLDNGTTYDVAAQGVDAGVADTLFRCMASYTLEAGSLHLYGVKAVFSEPPLTAEEIAERSGLEATALPRDPVKLVSVWRAGGYVNLQIGVMTTGVGKHAFAFCAEGDGEYSLLHLRPANDAESYTETVYLSMPVPDGETTISFGVMTYEGLVTVRS